MLNDIINVVNVDADILEKIISSDLYLDVEKLYEPQIVIKQYQWMELYEKYELHNFDEFFNIINRISHIYNEIKELIDSSSIKWITSIQIKKDDLKLINIFLKSNQ